MKTHLTHILALFMAFSPVAIFPQSAATTETADIHDAGDSSGTMCIRLYDLAIAMGDHDLTADYNAACCFALSGETGKSFSFLDKAAAKKFKNVQRLEEEPDLATLRHDPRWPRLMARIKELRKAYLKTINAEVFKLYEQDQADRLNAAMDMVVMEKRDQKRRQRVKELLSNSKRWTADDFFYSAMIFQHGTNASDFKLAKELAERAAKLNPSLSVARWLSAAAQDRYLQSTGKPQIYGTQFVTTNSGQWTLGNFDKTAVTDEDRRRLGVPSLAVTQQFLDTLNKEGLDIVLSGRPHKE